MIRFGHIIIIRPVGLLAAILLLCACTDSTPRLPQLAENAVILAFGDSLTHGNGAKENRSYPAVLSRLAGHPVINAGVPGEVSAQGRERLPALLDRHRPDLLGVPGEVSAQGRERLPALLDRHRPDLLLLCHGGNDFLRRINADITRSNIEAMIEAAAQRNIPVILIGVPKLGLIFLESAELYSEIADKYKLVYEGEILPDVESDNALKSDQIHPNAAGYQRIAEAIYRLMSESGALP
jgi:lysophospholipase L1-like esterase